MLVTLAAGEHTLKGLDSDTLRRVLKPTRKNHSLHGRDSAGQAKFVAVLFGVAA